MLSTTIFKSEPCATKKECLTQLATNLNAMGGENIAVCDVCDIEKVWMKHDDGTLGPEKHTLTAIILYFDFTKTNN